MPLGEEYSKHSREAVKQGNFKAQYYNVEFSFNDHDWQVQR